MNGLTRNRGTPEARAFWDSVDQASEQVKRLPQWMQDKMTRIKTTTTKYSMSMQDLMTLVTESLDIPVGIPGTVRINFGYQRTIEVLDDGTVSMRNGDEEMDTNQHCIWIETEETERDE